MFKRIVFLVLIAAFCFSFSLLFAQSSAVKPRQAPAKVAQKTDRIQVRIDELTKELGLTPEQQDKAKAILANSAEETRGILEAARDKVKEIRVKSHDEIMLLLTPEQRAKFKETRKKHETAPKIAE